MFGAAEPVADAQIIAMALSAFKRLGLEDVGLQLNSIGCPECRKEYHKALKEYFTARKEQLCDTCLSRLERNPMRILDCKSPECQEVCKGAPKITDYLCGDCKAHFAKVQEFLTALGIEFEIDPGLVRGLDYYTRTVFEFPSKSLGFALGGGGRYDGLVEEFGGKPTPGSRWNSPNCRSARCISPPWVRKPRKGPSCCWVSCTAAAFPPTRTCAAAA